MAEHRQVRTTIRMTSTSFEITTRRTNPDEEVTIPLTGSAERFRIKDDTEERGYRLHYGWRGVTDDQKSAIAQALCSLHGITAKRKRKPRRSVEANVAIIVDTFTAQPTTTEWERPEYERDFTFA